jgi:hypothetical protein
MKESGNCHDHTDRKGKQRAITLAKPGELDRD